MKSWQGSVLPTLQPIPTDHGGWLHLKEEIQQLCTWALLDSQRQRDWGVLMAPPHTQEYSPTKGRASVTLMHKVHPTASLMTAKDWQPPTCPLMKRGNNLLDVGPRGGTTDIKKDRRPTCVPLEWSPSDTGLVKKARCRKENIRKAYKSIHVYMKHIVWKRCRNENNH